jgi:pilus assembly protein CpaC
VNQNPTREGLSIRIVRRFWSRSLPLVLMATAAAAEIGRSPVELSLTAGGSAVIDYPADISRISISNPEVVDTVAVSRREILLQAKSSGTATIVVWAKSGERSFYRTTVSQNLEPVRKLLQDTFPKEDIHVQAARDSLSLTGRVSSQTVAERVATLVAPMAKSVVNNLEVADSGAETQILLRVRFAELDRTASSSLGVNLFSTGTLNTPGRITTGQFPAPAPQKIFRGQDLEGVTGKLPGSAAGTTSNFSISDALNIFAFRPDLNLGALIKALQSEGVLQILAEPNLVTTVGKEASFLVGGEFPIPIVQGGANVGAVTIQFREFGIRLTFLPLVTNNRTIKLHVKPEVSSLDFANGVVLSGFTIPGLITRRMETHIELSEGQSFVIAGLIDDRATENLSKVPGLASIPVLGTLFKSRQENRSKTELVVMVTPEITNPLEAAKAMPMPVLPKEFLLKPVIPAQTKGSAAKRK